MQTTLLRRSGPTSTCALSVALLLLSCDAGPLSGAPDVPDVPGVADLRLSYPDLVRRLADLRQVATLPPAGERSALWSSHDRHSRYDAASGRYLEWDANADWDGAIREEDGVKVLGEMEGPGAIVRIWSATPEAGHVRIYLDGASEPAVDLPFRGYFDGSNAPFDRPTLVHRTAQGWNNYTPIPYQRSCKIVADHGWGAFYQFTYLTFAPGTEVPTFSRQLSDEDVAALDEVDRLLAVPGPRSPAGSAVQVGRAELPAGGSQSVRLAGPGALSALRLKLAPPSAAVLPDLLSQVFIEIRWDGEAAASVSAPLAAFFGAGPALAPYRSLPAGVTSDGWLYANWFMPFATSAEVSFRNQAQTPCSLSYELSHEPLVGDLSGYARFHAKWHGDAVPSAGPDRAVDWRFLTTSGRGRFVGLVLQVWNPEGGWWGEGDEKFFVDGEKVPSSYGTGSEDYFGYAWCDPTLFQHALHNQTYNDGDNRGHVVVNRWHLIDQVPFQESFEGVLEKYPSPASYASTSYWYLAPGGIDLYRLEP